MMKKIMTLNKKKFSIVFAYVLPLLSMVSFFLYYKRLPDNIPYLWDLEGRATLFTKNAVVIFVIPAISLIYNLLCHISPCIDPKKDNYLKFENIYYVMVLFITVILTLAYITYVISIFYPNLLPFIIAVKVFVSLTVIYIGNNLPRIKDNNFFGIVNPWTKASHYVWYKTHRFGARIYVFSGIILLFLAFFNLIAANVTGLSILIALLIAPHIYSANRYYVKCRGEAAK